jgi:hypothetical protein
VCSLSLSHFHFLVPCFVYFFLYFFVFVFYFLFTLRLCFLLPCFFSRLLCIFYWSAILIFSLWTLTTVVYECLFIDILYLQVWKSSIITEFQFIIKSNILMGSWQKTVLIKNATLQINKHFHYAATLTITLACILFMSITILWLQNMAPNRIITTPVRVTLIWK